MQTQSLQREAKQWDNGILSFDLAEEFKRKTKTSQATSARTDILTASKITAWVRFTGIEMKQNKRMATLTRRGYSSAYFTLLVFTPLKSKALLKGVFHLHVSGALTISTG